MNPVSTASYASAALPTSLAVNAAARGDIPPSVALSPDGTVMAAPINGIPTAPLLEPAAARFDSARLNWIGSTNRETTAAEQVALWEAQFLKHRMEPHPGIAFAFQWLKTHAPVAERISLVHGDYRLGNFLFEDERITALLDWEMAHLGDPAEDIAWAYRSLWTPEIHLPIDGFVERYHARGGPTIRPENLLFYRLFGEIKHAIISLTAARSFADGRTNNLRMADRMTLALPCIKQFLAWLPT